MNELNDDDGDDGDDEVTLNYVCVMTLGIKTSHTADQASGKHEKMGRQTITTTRLLDTRRIRTPLLAYLSAIPTTGSGIPSHNHASTSLAAGNHQSCTEGKEPGERINRLHVSCSCFINLITSDFDDAGDMVEEDSSLENGEGVLGSRQVVWKDGLAYLYHW